ncbi:MAG: tetratricopeptide repeat protein [Deltaproteobacteria bacterium]|nr:tetratricopeptide repeat protein [Deltaproteobacteria bacterium]
MLCDYCYRRSVYHRLRGEEGLRREWVEKMTRAAGDYDQALMLTGRAFFEMGRTGEAEIYFRRALKKNPKNRVALHYLGRLAEERKEKARLSERGDS